MTQVRIIGDVHGRFRPYRQIIRDIPFSVQLSDMGVGFFRYHHGEVKPMANPPFDAMSQGRHLFIRGNHDNPAACNRQRQWIPDGTLLAEGIFCVGGALSMDRTRRMQGMDWWHDEECSAKQLETIIDRYSAAKPDIVCTHECPHVIAQQVMHRFRIGRVEDGSRTRPAFDRMLAVHQSRLWFFGHWHHSITIEYGRTHLRCLAELEFADVDL